MKDIELLMTNASIPDEELATDIHDTIQEIQELNIIKKNFPKLTRLYHSHLKRREHFLSELKRLQELRNKRR